LEIGIGTGLLSYYLASNGYQITSIEPAEQGFGMMTSLHGHVKNFFSVTNTKLTYYSSTLEDFTPKNKFDYIFSINVFEHMENPQQGLTKTNFLLNDGGIARIIAPNYGVPYEPHFHIPILLSKKITYIILRPRILAFNCFDPIGLWKSLNWISIRKSQRLLIRESIPFTFSLEATELYFGRLDSENEFLARKGLWFKVIATKLKFILRFLPVNLYPIFDLRIQKSKEDNTRKRNRQA
jgi:SAM-dependent methyltransferase